MINSSPGREPKPCCCLFPKEESKLSLAWVAPSEENTLFLEAAEAEAGAAPELAVTPAPDKASCRVTQPPGGSATKLFDQETPAPVTPPQAKPYRCGGALQR